MKTCALCKKGKLERVTTTTKVVEVDGHVFSAQVPALKCSACKETLLDGPTMMRLEEAAAAALAEAGVVSPPVLAFQRKALGLSGRELAELLDVSPEHLSRWENGKAPIDRLAAALVGNIALEHVQGRSDTLNHLRAVHAPKALPRAVMLRVA